MTEPDRRVGLGVIFLTVFVDMVGFSIIFPLFPSMLEHYLALEPSGGMVTRLVELLNAASGATGETAMAYTETLFGGVLGSLYSVLQFVCAPLWGAASDRVGRRPILLMTIGGLALSYLLWAVSGSFLLFVVSRLVAGVMSGNISAATAAVADVTAPKDRAKGMGFIGAAFGLGFILGPALGSVLSVVDLTEGPLSSIPGINPFSAAAAGAFVLSAWNLVWVVWKFKEPLRVGPSDRPKRPINPAKLFTSRDLPGVSRVNYTYFIFLVAFTGMEFTLTFLARDRFDYSALKMALLFIFSGLIVAGVQGGVVRQLAPRFGEKRLAIGGLLLVAPGLTLVGIAQTEWLLYTGLGALSVGSALAMPSLSALVSLLATQERQGEVLGVFRSLGALSRAVGPIIACVVYWRFGSQWPYIGALIPLAFAVALGAGIPTPPQHHAT